MNRRRLIWCIGALVLILCIVSPFVLLELTSNTLSLKQESITATVLNKLNQDADPCEDFYEFAYGTFLKTNIISETSPSKIISNTLAHQLQAILNEPVRSNEINPFQDAKKFYRACLNTDTIEERGIAPVKMVINSMGGWPVAIDYWIGDTWSWYNSVTNSRAKGYSHNYFISLFVDSYIKDTTKRIVYIDQATLALNREYLIKNVSEPFVEAYYNYQVDVAVMFGASRIRAESDMKAVLDFEIKLAKISLAQDHRRDFGKLYFPMTVETLQSTYNYADGHNWLSYINSLLPPESQLSSDDTIVVVAPTFFEQLDDLLARTPNRVLANYIAWRQIHSSVNELPSKFRQRQHEFHKILRGNSYERLPWLECLRTSLQYYDAAIGALYVRKNNFTPKAKTEVSKMVDNIKFAFTETLKKVEWIDNETKSIAMEKVASIKAQIGFAQELMDDTKLIKFYEVFPDVNEKQYYETILKLNGALHYRWKRRLREPVDKTDWTLHIMPAIVNANYSPLENTIAIPAGILQGTFFNYAHPQYMNYGGIGFVISHEIIHGFDDIGSQFDAVGNLRNWWTYTTREKFLMKAKCIIDQYGSYTEPLTNLKLNGFNSQGENIADVFGMKHAYRAYLRWATNNIEPKIAGLDYTPKQMFWISAAQNWCTTYHITTLKDIITTNSHIPAQFRINVPLSNLKVFSEDFHCAVGTRMNPLSKCEVW